MDAHTDLPDWRRTERQRLIAAREGVPAGQRAARNGVITALLDHGFPALRRLIVGYCWPYRGEFDARFLIRTLRCAGARAALPDVVARATPLVFREWWPGVAMTKRVFDLPVPDGTAVVQPQALLIPLVGFDERGFRLGYGGGYFDRTLAAQAVQPLRIGIGFELSRMPTIHPQPYDVAMDFIVTEAGIHSVGTGGLERIDAGACARRVQTLLDERFSAEQRLAVMNTFESVALPGRLRGLAVQLECGLVERRVVVRRCLLTALAGEHTLLIGPPGTAKSELARRLRAAFRDARYFERLLTRFTVPEELFGPLSIRALEEDRYERHTAGFLPDASIAFIDEVFKANSAILNALLTLLNEREFDNGAGRQRCPLVSVIGATNDVPEDEVGEAFFDRFLTRLPVAPVSADGFAALLDTGCTDPWSLADEALALADADLAALAAAARQVVLPAGVAAVLSALRTHLAAEGGYVSDRRWVKTLWLLRVAAASEGRISLRVWDLLLLPACVAPDATRQAAVGDWLTRHLGVGESCAPARLARVVQAFEAQLEAERKANDLDYDDAGRLRFSASELSAGSGTELAIDLAEQIGDAKGGAGALRMSYSRQRRYGPAHIGARTAQIDDLLARITGYRTELEAERASLADCRRTTLWLDDAELAQVERHLAATASALADLVARARDARRGFENLPRLPADVATAVGDAVPEPVLHEPLA